MCVKRRTHLIFSHQTSLRIREIDVHLVFAKMIHWNEISSRRKMLMFFFWKSKSVPRFYPCWSANLMKPCKQIWFFFHIHFVQRTFRFASTNLCSPGRHNSISATPPGTIPMACPSGCRLSTCAIEWASLVIAPVSNWRKCRKMEGNDKNISNKFRLFIFLL